MHHHLEIIMPPTDDVQSALNEILSPFDENQDEDSEDNYLNKYAFWDYWTIGGRWSGHKLMAMLDKEKMATFYAQLTEKKITVSILQFGKQTLQPPEQAETVNEIWNTIFPESPIKVCPIFDNYKDNYRDIQKLGEVARALECSKVIVAAPKHDDTGLKAEFMISDSVWNGVTHVDSSWDSTFGSALDLFLKRIKNYRDDYRQKITPTADWLVVTIDYHS